MKIKILFILLLTNFSLFGQVTKKLVDTNKVWSTLNHLFPYGYETYFTKFSTDTLINSLHYLKVYKTIDSSQTNWTNDGYIREDSSHKVFYKKDISQTEFLLYDFSVQVGDTIDRYINQNLTVHLKVDSINTINIAGSLRKRFYLWAIISPLNDEIWIEGIGSLLGIFYSGYYGVQDSQAHDLLCYYENDTLKYINPQYNVCYFMTEDLNENSKDNICVTISPNPVLTSSVFKVDNLNWTNNILEIYSYSGQKLKTIRLDNQTTLNKSDFSSGLYIYRLITKASVLTGKFKAE